MSSVTHNPYEPYCAFCAAYAMCQDCSGTPAPRCGPSMEYAPVSQAASITVPSIPVVASIPSVPSFAQEGNCNVYIRNLPISVNDEWLRVEFSRFGLVTSAKVMTSHAKKSKGYGFVQYTEPHMAALAVSAMNGCYVGQYCLNVKLADRDKDRGLYNQPSTNLYVSNLPHDYGVSEISALFAPYGAISSMVVLTDPHNGGSRGVGLVRYYTVTSATSAIESLHGRVIAGHDRPLEVKFAENQEEKHMRKATIQKATTTTPPSRGRQTNSISRRYPSIPGVESTIIDDHVISQMDSEMTREYLQGIYPSAAMPLSPEVRELERATAMLSLSKPSEETSAPLYVYGVETNMKELELYKLFAPFGAVVSVRMEGTSARGFDGHNEKCCVVQYRTDAQAAEAMKGIQGLTVAGRRLNVFAGDYDPSLLPAGA